MNLVYNVNWKPIQKKLNIDADGYAGKNTLKALSNYFGCDENWKSIQLAIGTTADGIAGQNTISKIMEKMGIETPLNSNILPQSKVRTNKSVYGRAGDESNLVNVPVPTNYPLKYEGKPVKTIRIHKLVKDNLSKALQEIADYYENKYGSVEEAVKKVPGIYNYSGSYNFRKTTAGSVYSMHAYGLALDFDAENNTYHMKKDKARLARPEYKEFFDILEKYGCYSLGRRSNLDWMHIQFSDWN